MGISRNSINLAPFVIILCLTSLHVCMGEVNIIIKDDVNSSRSLVLAGGVFRLQFFSPGNSNSRYVGILYIKVREVTSVWVANRDSPINDYSGVFKISDDGNLAVLDGRNKVLWKTNVTGISGNNTKAQLLDSGNLVLQVGNNSVWESFKDPAHVLLPTMKVGIDPASGENGKLTSWKSSSDPSIGDFFFAVDSGRINQVITWKGSERYWRSGPWDGQIFIGVDEMYSVYQNGFSLITDVDKKGSLYMTVDYVNTSLIAGFFLNSTGTLINKIWDEEEKVWDEAWLAPGTECDIYGTCGPFGICDPLAFPICNCLIGFKPNSGREWTNGNWSGGCVRKTELQCERNITNGEKLKGDRFLLLENVKVPDFPNWGSTKNIGDCRQECLNTCSCVAHSYKSGIGCMIWSGNLLDMQKFSISGVDLYIRLAAEKKNNTKLLIIIVVTVGVFSISILGFLLWRCMVKTKVTKIKYKGSLFFKKDDPTSIDVSDEDMFGDNPELPIFTFKKLAIATNNFSVDNKLGEGGFGSVYKGTFSNGQLIAIKRLSKSSGQGSAEFKNEVVVISKLQHRNLVRLVGCCIEGEEKMLIYEYMSNKSLDTFLFDPSMRRLLDWRKRFQIIEGICRGILYLHRDSMIKVIHRDLKASNILLDEELNPKISDFGMARIFGGNKVQANTIRVVGTYGYMSPEYAMEGIFSEKSDVFSLGVLLLEIVSGKKNTSFNEHEQSLSLLGHAWKLWKEGNIQALIDPILSEPHFQEEILRCIHVGFLCVQDFAKDRPIVLSILSMLISETTYLPTPKQPAFTERQIYFDSESSEASHRECSINNVSITTIHGR